MDSYLNLIRACLVCACATLTLALPAAAAAAPQLLVPSGSGLTDPAGVAVTPDDAIWVADGEKGVCRVRTQPFALIESDWCGDGPIDKTGQMGFDPATNNLYVAEGSSDAAGVWRLHWDPATGAITSGTKIVTIVDDLVNGLALSYTGPPVFPGGPPGAEVNFLTKDNPAVRRVRAPASMSPSVITVGSRGLGDEAEDGNSLAALGADLYLSEPSGVTIIHTQAGTSPVARPVPGLSRQFPAGRAFAVATDEARSRVYAGTSNGNARDQVDVLHAPTGRLETYAVGVAGVLAMVPAANGDLIILDDPANGVDADVNDQARLWRAELTAIGLPRAAITAAPPVYGASHTVRFEYSGPPDAPFECSVDDGPFEACGGPDTGSSELVDLDEGTHFFAVRAIDPIFGTGPVDRHVFVIDSVAPELTIDNAAADRYPAGNSFTLRFSANETNLDFTCSVSDGPTEPCSPSTHIFGALAPGWHTARVSAVDAAGNVSADSEDGGFAFYVRPPAAPTPPGGTSPPPDRPAARPAVPPPVADVVPRGEARLRLARGYSCVIGGQKAWVSGSSIAQVTFRTDGRRLAVLTRAGRRGRWSVRLPKLAAGRHTLSATVRFVPGAGEPERLRREFKRCGRAGGSRR